MRVCFHQIKDSFKLHIHQSYTVDFMTFIKIIYCYHNLWQQFVVIVVACCNDTNTKSSVRNFTLSIQDVGKEAVRHLQYFEFFAKTVYSFLA